MRLKLFLSFSVIILITVTSMVLIVRQNTVEEVHEYMFRGGMMGLNSVVNNLEQCYQETQTWESCTPYLQNGNHPENVLGRKSGEDMGRGPSNASDRSRLRLLDDQGIIIEDTGDTPDEVGAQITSLEGAIPLRDQNEVAGYLLPESPLVFSEQNESLIIQRLNRAALTAALISGITALILASVLGYHLLKPVQSLTEAAENIKGGELSHRVEINGAGELAALGQIFNQMTSAIEQTAERRKALTADIAHELRTPLSVQQAHLEAMEDGIYALTVENLRPIHEQNQTLARLVDDLRTLALADSGELTLERTRTAFTQLAERVIDRFHPKSKEKDVEIQFTPPEKLIMAYIDPQRVEQIITNLLSNALRHSPQKENIEVNLNVQDDQLSLAIRDRGEGILEDEIPFIFERFYKSKIKHHKDDGGTGLGLSISQKLAQAHGGSIQVRNHPHRGAVFQLNLPLSS